MINSPIVRQTLKNLPAILLGLCLGSLPALANAEEEADPPAAPEIQTLPSLPQADQPDPQQQTQSERQKTVARALQNLQSAIADERRAAVMLLGKYNLPEAREGVIRALTDESGSVRLAAVVSLFESPRNLPRQAQWQVFALLGDEEVSIRRIVSNVLPFVASAFPVSFDRDRREPQRDLPEEFEKLAQDAFADEDALVRRNMISNYRQLYIPLPEERLIALLHDPDPEVAMIALQTGDRVLSSEVFSREAKSLVDRDERTYRLNLTRYLAHHREPDALRALDSLSEDEDRQVRLEASLALFANAPSKEDYQALLDELQTGRLYPETTEKILQAAAYLGTNGKTFLVEGLSHQSTLYRRHSAETLFRYYPREVSFEEVQKLLHDDARDIRERAVNFLLRHGRRWSPHELQGLIESPHPVNRLALLKLLPRIPENDRRDILMELLLDDHHEVQTEAVELIAQEKIPNWETILFRATRLDSPETRRKAIHGLLRNPTPEAQDYLKQIIELNPNSREARQIEAVLQNQ
ncbi:MAG: hypothetical protein JJT75_09075 [Opitutales bacterium]|nr:hypothetical protein [Opitutales bacterium]MCH8539255.1 hypothetical protein [Opitutales bacterium]